MTHVEARALARGIVDHLPIRDIPRLKGMDVCPRLHQGMLTIRVYFTNSTAPDPDPYIFKADEIL